MNKLIFIKNEFKYHVRMLPQFIALIEGRLESSPEDKKFLHGMIIRSLKKLIKKSLISKVNKGKINQEYTLFLMDWLVNEIKEYNQLKIYSVKNDVVQPRDVSTFPELTFIRDFSKGGCKINLEILEQMERQVS